MYKETHAMWFILFAWMSLVHGHECLYDASTYRSFVDPLQTMTYIDVVVMIYAYLGYILPSNPIALRVARCADYDLDNEISYSDTVKMTYAYLGYVGVHLNYNQPPFLENPSLLFNLSAYVITASGVNEWRSTLPASYEAAGRPGAGTQGTLNDFSDAPISFPYSIYGTYFLGKDPILLPFGYSLEEWRPIGKQLVDEGIESYVALPQRDATTVLDSMRSLTRDDFYWCDIHVGCTNRSDVLVDIGDSGFGFRHPGAALCDRGENAVQSERGRGRRIVASVREFLYESPHFRRPISVSGCSHRDRGSRDGSSTSIFRQRRAALMERQEHH